MSNQLVISDINQDTKTITVTSSLNSTSNTITISSSPYIPYIPYNEMYFMNSNDKVIFVNYQTYNELMEEKKQNKRVKKFNKKFQEMLDET